MILDLLKEIDTLKSSRLNDINLFYHNEHRYVLNLLDYYQRLGYIPRPCNVILFDAHHDTAPLINKNDILEFLNSKYSEEMLLNLCQNSLSKNDDDWVTAGFELGIIDHIIIFGVCYNLDAHPDNIYTDHKGNNHKIYLLSDFPRDGLHSRGWLCDISAMEENKEMMDIIEWGLIQNKGFNFRNISNKLALSIDLDCFTINWKDELLIWPEELFTKKFLEKSTNGWSGRLFMSDLHRKLGIITIAKEPNYCGGLDNSERILLMINRYLFNDQLFI